MGRKISDEHKQKLIESHKGKKPSKETIEKIKATRMANGGYVVTPETRNKISQTLKRLQIKPPGRKGPLSEQHKTKLLEGQRKYWSNPRNHLNRSGSGCHLWKGGITPINMAIRKSLEYKTWHDTVFKRDKYTCQECGQIGGRLHADHIKSFSKFPDLRFELSNGRTLCKSCHIKTDTYGWKGYWKTHSYSSQTT